MGSKCLTFHGSILERSLSLSALDFCMDSAVSSPRLSWSRHSWQALAKNSLFKLEWLNLKENTMVLKKYLHLKDTTEY